MWLYFDTETDCTSAMNIINERLGIPDGLGTTTWADPVECVNGKWAFIRPECDLTGLPSYTEKQFDKLVDLGLDDNPEVE